MINFFDNGLAEETEIVTVYGYSDDTGEFSGVYSVKIIAGTGIPAFSTLIPPPNPVPGNVFLFKDGSWHPCEDHRGDIVYSTSTLKFEKINYIGPIKPGFTTIEPLSPNDKWDGEKWIHDNNYLLQQELNKISNKYNVEMNDLNGACLAAIVSDGPGEPAKQQAVRDAITARKAQYAADKEAARLKYPV
ncbi:hypothetical protein [Edwardsiella tarda]|uniref:hypothetical protein n=1 Tax=Edwardsiella tarda TaxID=636 RepID=UPI0030819BC8|nr:hypothetical protein GBS0709_24170 [Edwardsiella tarda]